MLKAINEASVKRCGRTYLHGDVLWMSLSCTGIEFKVDGSFCEIVFAGDKNAGEAWGDTVRTRMGIFVDGKLEVDFLMDEKVKTVKVFDGEPGKRIVRLVKLSESTYSTIGIRGIKSDGNIVATRDKDLKIEFVGDSLTCGYGVDGTEYESFSTANENASKSYAYLTALELDADYSLVSYSGFGVVSGHTVNGYKQAHRTLPECYSKFGKSDYTFAGGLLPSRIDWDHGGFVPDIVIINLGTNDYFYTGDSISKMEEFKAGYIDFLKVVRNKNTHAYILCTLGMVGAELYCTIEEAVEVYTKDAEDARISCMKFDNQLKEDGYGVMMHPTAITHEKAARKLVDHIRGLGID